MEYSVLKSMEKILLCCLSWTLINAQIQTEQSTFQGKVPPINPYNNVQNPQQLPHTLKGMSPLMRTLFSRLTPAESYTAAPEPYPEPTVKSLDFFTAFLQHLQKNSSETSDQPSRLELTIQGGSSAGINIEFLPTFLGNDNFNSIVDLLADALALVVREAEKLGFNPSYKYLVSLVEPQGVGFAGPALSATALKSAVG